MSDPSVPSLSDQLQIERDRLAHFAATVHGWFWESDADLRFTYLSDSVEWVTGRTPQSYYGRTREEIGIQLDLNPQAWRAHFGALRRREPFERFEYPIRGPAGIRWMRVSGSPFRDGTGRFLGYRGVGTEVTGDVLARQTSEQLIAAIDNIGDLIVLWDADDRLVVCNRPVRELYATGEGPIPERGAQFADLVRSAVAAGIHPEAEADPDAWVEWRVAAHRNPGAPFEMRSRSGQWWRVSEYRLPDAATLTLSVDITAVKQRELDMIKLASTDELTGLANRREFLLAADSALGTARKDGRPLAILVLDADHFKEVNDSHGHAAGDEALRTLARIVNACTRERDVVGRLGGEEFAAVLPDASQAVAVRVAERIRAAAAVTCIGVNRDICVTLSIGVATLVSERDTLESLLERADAALYGAKDKGRNRVELASTVD